MQKNLETFEQDKEEGAYAPQHNGLRDENPRDRIKDVGAEDITVKENDHNAFKKRAECRKGCDQGRSPGIDLSTYDIGEIKNENIQKHVEPENRAGQTIQEETEQKGQDASMKGVEMEPEVDNDDKGDLYPDPAKGKEFQNRELDDHEKKQEQREKKIADHFSALASGIRAKTSSSLPKSTAGVTSIF